MVIIDGAVSAQRSRNTPPATAVPGWYRGGQPPPTATLRSYCIPSEAAIDFLYSRALAMAACFIDGQQLVILHHHVSADHHGFHVAGLQ